jgi:sugar lactone lactonase YvrE
MPVAAACIVDARAQAGESPVWSVGEQCLWWVDLWGRRLHRFDAKAGVDRAFAMPDIVTFAAPHERGGLAVCLRSSVWHVDPERGAFALLAEVPLPQGARLNDAVVDPLGGLWIGSMATSGDASDGALWRVDAGGAVDCLLEGLRSPNGLAFSPDHRTLYLSDSHPSVRTVWRFDVDSTCTRLSDRRVYVDTHALPGRPDGACTDTRGRYWMAAVDGSAVLCLDHDANVVDSVALPVEKPSKPAFGGPSLDTLYVTSLRRHLHLPIERQPQAGGLFAARVDATGIPTPACRIAVR